MLNFKDAGIQSNNNSLILKMVINRSNIPEIRLAVMANSTLFPIPNIIEKAKKELMPKLGANAKGKFPTTPTRKVAISELTTVAVNTDCLSLPTSDKFSGTTANI